jgi:hypothetical protein
VLKYESGTPDDTIKLKNLEFIFEVVRLDKIQEFPKNSTLVRYG